MRRAPVVAAVLWLASCAGAPEELPPPKPPKPARVTTQAAPPPVVDAAAVPDGGPPAAAAEPPAEPPMETTHLTEAQWRKQVGEKVGTRLGVPPADLRFSPMGTRIAVLQGPPPPPPGRKRRGRVRYRIVVVDSNGKRQGVFSPVTVPRAEEPPGDLRFLGEDRLVYEVMLPPPPEPKKPKAAKARAVKQGARTGAKVARKGKQAKGAPQVAEAPERAAPAEPKPGPPRRLFVIQPLAGKRRRPIRCDGTRFVFNRAKDHLAFVSGQPEKEQVSVDGTAIYPRRGRTTIASEPAWSKDGQSLAFLEARDGASPRLVLIPVLDNPSGDTTWDLPATAPLEALKVFWAGEGRLVVGKTTTKPVFSTTFTVEKPR